jgi:hypothetical protein
MLKKSSPLKLLGQMEPNLAGRSCCADHFYPVRFLILLTVFELLSKTCNFTICSIFSNSDHVCWPNGTKWRSFIEDMLILFILYFKNYKR